MEANYSPPRPAYQPPAGGYIQANNGYIQPRSRSPQTAQPTAPSQVLTASIPPTRTNAAPVTPAAGAAPRSASVQPGGYIVGGYQPRPLTLPDPEALAAKLNMDAYHVIRIEYFSLRFEPVLTVRDGNVVFNASCIRGIDDAVWIHFLMGDEDDNTLVIRPRKEGTRGAVRWCVAKDNVRKSRSISCERLTNKLYRRMNWQKIYHYKLVGTRVPYKGEEVYVFFLDSAIPVSPAKVTPDGKRIGQRIIEPEEWATNYGPTVKELEASTQIDLAKGYTTEMIEPREIRRDSSRSTTPEAVPGEAEATNDQGVTPSEEVSGV